MTRSRTGVGPLAIAMVLAMALGACAVPAASDGMLAGDYFLDDLEWAPPPPPASRGDDRDEDGVDDADDDVVGRDHWVRSAGTVLVWYRDGAEIELRVDERPQVRLPTPVDLSTISVEPIALDAGYGGVVVRAPTPWVALLVPRTEGRDEVCYVDDAWGVIGASADCSGPGAVRLACPSAEGEVTCELEGERYVVRGPRLRMAWEPTQPLGAGSDTEDDDESESLRDAIIRSVPPGPVLCSRCSVRGATRSCRLTSGIPGVMTCNGTCWSECRPRLEPLRLERCNGVDDDADGRVDERPQELCDDGTPCTRDTCGGASGCANRPIDTLCDEHPGTCALTTCAPPSSVPEGDRVSERDRNGCYTHFRSSWCTSTWDGCACNGPEVCDPTGMTAAQLVETQGCIATPPRQWPCEASGGDDDACTTENCCEPYSPETCRDHRRLRDSIGDEEARRLFSMCTSDPRPPTHRVTTAAGAVQCVDGPLRYVGRERGQICHDGNPCTDHTCTGRDAHCTQRPIHGFLEGWDWVVQRGCGREFCDNGRWVWADHEPDPRNPEDCHGFVQTTSGSGTGVVLSSCLERQCDESTHRCVEVPRPAVCNDGQFCNGADTCTVADLTGTRVERSSPRPGILGCRIGAGVDPCDDGVACTRDVCNEPTDTCGAHVPSEYVCHDLNDVPYDACAPEFACEPGTTSTQTPELSGCVPRSGNPCTDSSLCTRDICIPDEFRTARTCRHEWQSWCNFVF